MVTIIAEYSNINPRYLDAIDKFTKEEIENANKAADYWHHKIGANVIPADTKIKKAYILKSWTEYQSKPVPLEVFERWKELGLFAYGIGVVLGTLWRGKYLNMVDADNQLALQDICSRNGKTISLEKLANWTLVEQHKDNIDRAHIYILSTKPFPTKASDKSKPDTANKIVNNEIPGIEVKNTGSLSFGWNSIHQRGHRYEFVDVQNPVLCDEYPEHINDVCKKYGLEYLDENGRGKGDIPIPELFKADTVIYEGNNRHKEQLRINDSLIARLRNVLSLDDIKQIAMKWNQEHCKGPLDDREFNRLFNQSTRFVSKNTGDEARGKADSGINDDKTFRSLQNREETKDIIEEASEAIMKIYRLVTIEETREIWYYREGVYVPGGDILIEKKAEAIYGYGLATRHLSEIKGHLMRKTYHRRSEIDADINIINLKNTTLTKNKKP